MVSGCVRNACFRITGAFFLQGEFSNCTTCTACVVSFIGYYKQQQRERISVVNEASIMASLHTEQAQVKTIDGVCAN
jgi:hypothetical protein